MNNGPLHSVSVAGVTVDEKGLILLIKRRDNGQWQAPGGVLELGETFEEGVAREVAEETGVDVYVDRLTGVYKNMARSVVALVYRCRPRGGVPQATQESSEVAWVSVDTALTLMSPAFAIRVQDATAKESLLPHSRAHDGYDLLQ